MMSQVKPAMIVIVAIMIVVRTIIVVTRVVIYRFILVQRLRYRPRVIRRFQAIIFGPSDEPPMVSEQTTNWQAESPAGQR
jgi:hypothetical protein